MHQLILGSSSPRRKELLSALGYNFRVMSPDIDETFPESMNPELVPEYVANKKYAALLPLLKENEILLCADTIVVLNNEILGKPANNDDAVNMILKLSNRWHSVITGFCIGNRNKSILKSVTSQVKFAAITEAQADYYVNNFNPLDKAGSYGIQDWIGMAFIERIEGSYTNIVGLPTQEVFTVLKSF
jgi:septum formation protein